MNERRLNETNHIGAWPRVAAMVLLIALLHSDAGAEEPPVNSFCPVMTDSPASPKFSIEYKGHRIGFCCTECIKEFEANPDQYVANLPQLGEPNMVQQLGSFVYKYNKFVFGLALSGLLLVLRVARGKAEKKQTPPTGIWRRLLTRRISPAVPLAVLLAVVGWQLWSARRALFFLRMEADIHFATFYDYGYPPIPDKSHTEKQLAGTYYRGNDERDDRLFNGGNYRTATFHIALENASGTPVRYNDAVAGQELFVVLEIDRPPHTPDFLYSDRFMKSTFLTGVCDPFLGYHGPVADRVNLDEIEPMQRWQARYSLGTVATTGENHLEGVVYVCEEYYYPHPIIPNRKSRGGSRYHYGIAYELSFADGRITADSDIWMGSLYRTRKFSRRHIPFEQWFSDKPIPEMPEKQPDDPELLGIDDYSGVSAVN